MPEVAQLVHFEYFIHLQPALPFGMDLSFALVARSQGPQFGSYCFGMSPGMGSRNCFFRDRWHGIRLQKAALTSKMRWQWCLTWICQISSSWVAQLAWMAWLHRSLWGIRTKCWFQHACKHRPFCLFGWLGPSGWTRLQSEQRSQRTVRCSKWRTATP